MTDPTSAFAGDRLAKVIARAGLCSRRDAELWIKEGRVVVNGKVIRTPAFNVTGKDTVKVDGRPLAAQEGTRVWLYHKPAGLVVTEKDPEGRPTVFEALADEGLPRVVSIGRLDINTEGLLLLTNDGGLKRVLELPATGWLRRYRVRAFGSITQPQLDVLKDGIEIDGVQYGPIEAVLEREQGSNSWLVLSLREGKNREVKNVLAALGLTVNRLIRVNFGPFQLGDLQPGAVTVVKARVLRDQLGKRLADEAGVDFDSEMPETQAVRLARKATNPSFRAAAPGKPEPKQRKAMADRNEPFRFTDRDVPKPEDRPLAKDRPGSRFPRRPAAAPAPARPERPTGPQRKVFNEDGTETIFEAKSYGRKPKPETGDKPAFGDRPKRDFGDRPKGDFGDRPKRPYSGRPAADGADRPKRPYGDKPKGDFGDRPKRPYSGRPAADGADRPKRAYGDKPKGDFGDRPKRPYTGRPAADGADKPRRPYGSKPGGARPGGDGGPKRPRGSGPGGDRPRRPRPPNA